MSRSAQLRAALRRRLAWIISVPVVLAILAIGGPYLFLANASAHNPPPLSFSQLENGPQAAALTGPDRVAGNWVVGPGSQARYGIDDHMLGRTSHVVGSTNQVSGSMHVNGTTVTATHVVVNMASVRCHCVHDIIFPHLLNTAQHRDATFTLTQPIQLGRVPAPGQVISKPVTGDFTINGVTRRVHFTLQATDINNRIAVRGTIPVTYQEFAINPGNSPGASLSNTTIGVLVDFIRP